MSLPDNATTVELPYYRYRNKDSTPAFNAKIYIGVANTDPKIPSNQIDVSAVGVGQSLTVLTQPIRTNTEGAAIDDVGNVVYPIVDVDYSIRVDTSLDVLIHEESFVKSVNKPSSGSGGLDMTVAEAKADTTLVIGDVVRISDRVNGKFDVVLASGVTVNNDNIFLSVATPTQAFVLRVEGFINIDQFGANEVDDAAGAIQSAIDFAQARDGDSTITSEGLTYTIKSTQVVPIVGGNVGLIVTNLSKARWDFNGGVIKFDDTDIVLGALAKDALIALVPSAEDGANAFQRFVDIRLSGGNFIDPAHRPKNVIKGDYSKMSYGYWEDVQCEFASEDVVILNQFVANYTRCRARFAGVNGAGFKFETVSGANTGILMNACTVDFAGLFGFLFTGSSGHTYCHLNNCHADFIGSDDNKITIAANVGLAYAYSINDVRGFNLTACGAEFSTALFRCKNGRSLRVDSIFGLGMGNQDGVTIVPDNIKITGFFEQINFANFENRSPKAGGFTDLVVLETPTQFNSNNITFDQSITKANVTYVAGGDQSSSNTPLSTSPEDLYNNQNRRGPGDAVKTGEKALGAHINAWASSTDILEQTFYALTSGSSVDKDLFIIESAGGDEMGFTFEITQTRSGANLAVSSFYGYLHYRHSTNVATIQDPERLTATLMASSGQFPTIAYNTGTRIVTMTLPNTFTGYYIKVTAIPRPSANYVRINWL